MYVAYFNFPKKNLTAHEQRIRNGNGDGVHQFRSTARPSQYDGNDIGDNELAERPYRPDASSSSTATTTAALAAAANGRHITLVASVVLLIIVLDSGRFGRA